MAEIIKAIIPVAGWGTRMLPITKAIEKCMLPVGKRPIIDYVVQDCLAAGIREFIFVVSEQSSQLEAYYRSNIHLNDYLRRKGKEDMLPLIAPLKANMHFVTQPSYGKYGTAVPVALASDYINTDESAVVLMGDDFMYNPDGSSEVARLIAATHESISRYGAIVIDESGHFREIVEKPRPEEAPSDYANIGKYVLTKQVIDSCADIAVSPRGEYDLTDAITQFAQAGGAVKVVPAVGRHLDGGSLDGWLYANNVVCGL